MKSLLFAVCVALASVGIYRILPANENSMNNFVGWFHRNGGWMSPKIRLALFPTYGYGLRTQQEVSIARHELLLTVPESIQFSEKSAKSKFHQLDPMLDTGISHALANNFEDPLERQDSMIAISLMLECSLGQASEFYPYLAILPPEISRLDTFKDEQLEQLQDASLETLARQSRMRLSASYKSILTLIQDLSNLGAERSNATADTSCLSFKSYHRFVAIASSHAMILGGIKYIVPMADMINHESRPSKDGEAIFESFHKRDSTSNAILVHADRSISADQQVFEEYGALDNSLYLVAHGFVPESNHHHCAILSASTIPRVTNPDLQSVLKHLHFVNEMLENMCVRSDGSVVGDTEGVIASYLAIAILERGNDDQLQMCIMALHTDEQEGISLACVNYSNSRDNIAHLIRASAAATLREAKTSLKEDLLLLRESEERSEPSSTLLALRFRIADKQVLETIILGELK